MTDANHCLICANPSLEYMFSSKGYRIASCGNCGFCQTLDPPGFEALDKLYADLHVNHTQYRDEQAAWRENISRLTLVKKYIPGGSLVLDAGCATGDFLAQAKENYTVYGLDISRGAIETAQTRLPDIADNLSSTPLESLASDLPLFDAICLWDVIEHVRDPVSICTSLLAQLKPGGHLFLSTPDMGALSAKVLKSNWPFMIPPLHLGFFSRKSFNYLFPTVIPHTEITHYETRGKWTSLAFILYKLNQISQVLAPKALLRWAARSRLGKINIYAPTNDVIYLAIKNLEKGE